MPAVTRGRSNGHGLLSGGASVAPFLPTFTTGTGAAVPVGLTVLTALMVGIRGVHFHNGGASDSVVSVTDTSGAMVVGPIDLPIGADFDVTYDLRPALGLKWLATVAGVNGHVWGDV